MTDILDDFDPMLVEALEEIHGDFESEADMYGWTPEESPRGVVHDWQCNSHMIVNGRLARNIHIAEYATFFFATHPCGGLFFDGYMEDGEYLEYASFDGAPEANLEWLKTNCKDAYVVTWQQNNSGDGILLPGYRLYVAFASHEDERAYGEAFPYKTAIRV